METDRYPKLLNFVLMITILASGYIYGYYKGHKASLSAMNRLTLTIEETIENVFKYGFYKGYEFAKQEERERNKFKSF